MAYTVLDESSVSALNAVEQLLNDAGINYALKGGFAVQSNIAKKVCDISGRPISDFEQLRHVVLRPTEDIDLVADAGVADIYIALNEPSMGVDVFKKGDDFVSASYVYSPTGEKIIIGANPVDQSRTPEYMNQAVQRRREIDIPYTAKKVINTSTMTPEDTIIGKLQRWDTRDIFDAGNLMKYFNIDRGYVAHVLAKHFNGRQKAMNERFSNLVDVISEQSNAKPTLEDFREE